MHSQYHRAEPWLIRACVVTNIQEVTVILLHARTFSHITPLPHLYRHCSYHKNEDCHFGTGTDSIPQQSIATLFKALTVSQNTEVTYLAVTPFSVHINFKVINWTFLVTSVNVPDLEAHSLFSANLMMAALWRIMSKFHCVSSYPDSTMWLHVVYGNNFIVLSTHHTKYIVVCHDLYVYKISDANLIIYK